MDRAGETTITLEPVPEAARADLRVLLDAHLAELSRYGPVDARYPYFEAYWREPDLRWPWFIVKGGARIGFALVRLDEAGASSMAEFWIESAARRAGAGLAAAVRVIRTRPGPWEISTFEANAPARAFWPRAIAAAGGQDFRVAHADGDVIHRFTLAARLGGSGTPPARRSSLSSERHRTMTERTRRAASAGGHTPLLQADALRGRNRWRAHETSAWSRIRRRFPACARARGARR